VKDDNLGGLSLSLELERAVLQPAFEIAGFGCGHAHQDLANARHGREAGRRVDRVAEGGQVRAVPVADRADPRRACMDPGTERQPRTVLTAMPRCLEQGSGRRNRSLGVPFG
jgi:hypothetical protein